MGLTAAQQVANIERLLGELEGLHESDGKDAGMKLVQALLDLYGQGLARIVEALAVVDDGSIARALAEDELVAHLLLLHGLHPDPVEQRVAAALEGVLPYLRSHGGDAELVEVREGVAKLRLQGSCSGCPSSTATLKLAIEEAIFAAAPDVDRVEAEGAVPQRSDGLIQLEIACPVPQR